MIGLPFNNAGVFGVINRLASLSGQLGIANGVMMTLGRYQFSLPTAAYDRFRRSRGWRWPSQDRIGRAPAMQYVGPDAETLDLSGYILPSYRGGWGQIEAMAREAGTGQPLLLVDGLGRVHGKWCITALDEGQSFFTRDGVPRRIEFDLSLVAYGDDATGASV